MRELRLRASSANSSSRFDDARRFRESASASRSWRGSKLKPVEALEEWLAAAAIIEGPVFRSIDKAGNVSAEKLAGASVALIQKCHCGPAGLDPAIFAGHSLRAGFVTSALEDGADLLKVMDVTRHRAVQTLKIYDRRAQAFRKHAGSGFL